ncbi:MAG TPA: tetratricopeptide repeat protein [Planctomycetota bacterium]|nr:tetratricopeptide repeat protein [Planctomycetota bacterium]
MIARGLVAGLCALALAASASSSQTPSAPAAEAPAKTPAETVGRWRELLELDLAREVAAEGLPLVSPDGSLEKEGEARALVARALWDAGRDSAELLSTSGLREGTHGFVVLERARQEIADDRLEGALARLRAPPGSAQAVAHPEHPQSWLLLGRALARSGDLAGAAPHLKRFLELAPLDRVAPAALHMLAEEALQRRDGAAAKAYADREQELARWHAYRRVRLLQIREKPREPLPRLGLGQLLLEAKQYGQARAVLEELVKLAPDFAHGWFHLGEARRMLDDMPGAEQAYSKALELNPALVLARYNRAVIALRAGREEEARADFEQIVADPRGGNPLMAGAHLALARLLLRAGEKEAAQASYLRYRELGGRDPLEPPADK